MESRKKLFQLLRRAGVMFLSLAVLLSGGLWLAGLQRLEPEDPVERHEELSPEPAARGRALSQLVERESAPGDMEDGPRGEPEEELPDLPQPQTKQDDASSPQGGDAPGESDSQGDPALPGGANVGAGEVVSPGEGQGGAEGPLQENPQVGPMDDSELRLVTNLSNGVITYKQLQDDTLPFEAYLVNGAPDMYLKVKIQNSLTARNGDYLKADGRNYAAKLAREESNRITIYIRDSGGTVGTYTYVISYIADKADANHPDAGEHPPVIITNLDSGFEELTNRFFTFLVSARTYEGAAIYENHIVVQLDGHTVKYPTGEGTYEYELNFPLTGEEYSEHTVSVLAWDDEGNSAYRDYRLTCHFGDTAGVCYVLIDMTTIGLGVTGSYSYEIKQGDTYAHAVLAMLADYGYGSDYSGSPDFGGGFYLRRISRAGMAAGALVPENLWKKIEDDGLQQTGQRFPDSVGEFDYTQGSGWMYSINGELFPGKGLSQYGASDGDTIYLRYTLAYGKDIGGSVGGYGRLFTYCGKWINGAYIDEHDWQPMEVIKVATCEEAGEEAVVCSVCGDKREQVTIPALGHDYQETARSEAANGEDGWIEYTCTRCQDSYREVLPAAGEAGPVEPGAPTEPADPAEPTAPPETPGPADSPGTTEPTESPAPPTATEPPAPTEPTESPSPAPAEPPTSTPTEPTAPETPGPEPSESGGAENEEGI